MNFSKSYSVHCVMEEHINFTRCHSTIKAHFGDIHKRSFLLGQIWQMIIVSEGLNL